MTSLPTAGLVRAHEQRWKSLLSTAPSALAAQCRHLVYHHSGTTAPQLVPECMKMHQ